MEAYATPADRDEIDRVARYLLNMALAGAMQGSLHVFEVTLRNAIYNASVKLIDTSTLRMRDVQCWLDADGSTVVAGGAEAFRPQAELLLIGRP